MEVGTERGSDSIDLFQVAHIPIFRTGKSRTGPSGVDMKPQRWIIDHYSDLNYCHLDSGR